MIYSKERPFIVLYGIAGAALEGLLEPFFANKEPLPLEVNLGILAVVLLLGAWNVKMYLNARNPGDPEFPTSAIERYTRPVIATASFVVGFGIFFVGMITK